MAGDGIPVYGAAGRGRIGWTESGQDRLKPGLTGRLDGSIHVAKVRVADSNLVVRSTKPQVSGLSGPLSAFSVAHHAHHDAHHIDGQAADRGGVTGSMRQRASGSWGLRVYAGVDPDTGRRRYRTTTVRGTRAEAKFELAEVVAGVRAEAEGGVGSPVSV